MERRRTFMLYGALVLFAFALNLVWERAHMSLYMGYGPLGQPLPLPLWAALGDVFYILVIVLAGALAKRRLDWLYNASSLEYGFLAAAGILVALYIEKKALLLNTWSYTPAMPIIPGLAVGLSPIVQMALLLPLSAYLGVYAARKIA